MSEEKQVVIYLDDELWAKAKAKAAIEMRPLKEWIDEAIREKLGLLTKSGQDK